MFELKNHDPNFLPHLASDVEFSFQKGELIALVGDNGVGKTTLIKQFVSGQVDLASYIPQDSLDLFYDRPLRKLREIFLLARAEMINRSRFDFLWESFGLSQKEERYQSSLSGGEGQALKLTLGLSIERELYILDEPSQYLDTTSKAHLSRALQKLLQEGKSILLVEHDLSWAEFTGRKIKLLIRDNKLLQEEGPWTIS